MERRAGRALALAIALASLAGPSVVAPAARAAAPPSLRLYAVEPEAEVVRWGGRGFPLDVGVWVASSGGAFELRVSRPDYATPVGVVQADAATGRVLRALPADVLDGWNGLAGFLHVSVRDARGKLVSRGPFTFCPNAFERARLDDSGPLSPRYPSWCGGNPFTLGTVWGIDAGWAVNPLAYTEVGGRVPDGRYSVRVWIDPRFRELLGIAEGDAEVRVEAVLRTRGRTGPAPVPARTGRPAVRVPTVPSPSPSTVPDLVALPAWGISTYSRRGRDYLGFASTEWNRGPAPLLVEGFREQGEDVMQAYQYFTSGGAVVGRAPVGTLEFHRGGGHDHWHFVQFTEYSLLDAREMEVQVSGKQSWCLAPTDPIDLTLPNAEWAVETGLWTACGGPSAIWIREVLQVGWGDTYVQAVRGQAFDITDLPNGRYFIRVEVNPLGALHEVTDENNVALREIRLRGRPGGRQVIVPPWNGIDTEGGPGY
ncbi:MAG TPA: lysyl oxidase family protein [Actinomycetota bacterium]|nr:lysyl oxidase family protein [Actinomycetota bacterium]